MTKQKPSEVSEINLTQASAGLRKMIVGAGWDFVLSDGEALDLDLSCFVLGRDNLTREDEDFVFYNNPNGAALAVKHLGDDRAGAGAGDKEDESILVDFDNLSFDVWRIVFAVSIYQGNERDHTFNKLRELTLRFENADSGIEIHRISMNGSKLGDATAIRVAEIYRNGVEWHLVLAGDPIKGGLAEIARQYGLQISSTT